MIYIDETVCSVCHKETKDNVFKELLKKYKLPENTEKLDGTHPLWQDYTEGISIYDVNCIVFEYDNYYMSLCKKHIMEYVDKL